MGARGFSILALATFSVLAQASWKKLWSEGWEPPTRYPIRAYSEYMPAPLGGIRPYEPQLDTLDEIKRGHAFTQLCDPKRDDAYLISEYEERAELRPALSYVAKHWLNKVSRTIEGKEARGVPKGLLVENPYWDKKGPARAKGPVVSLTALTLSKSQDDKGRVRWTIYGGSPLGSESVLWESLRGRDAMKWLRALLASAFEKVPENIRLFSKSTDVPERLKKLVYVPGQKIDLLVTFEPFANWPEALREAYREEAFPVVPHPATLIFEGSLLATKLSADYPDALELPLSEALASFSGYELVRILPVRSLSGHAARRWYRFQKEAPKVKGTEADGLEPEENGPEAFRAIFDPVAELMGLYGKPIARNVQIWGTQGKAEGRWLFDGPISDGKKIGAARAAIVADGGGSHFHYREFYPPLRVNELEVRWHRPLVAWTKPTGIGIDTALLGTVRARGQGKKDSLSFHPELTDSDGIGEPLASDFRSRHTPDNVRKLLELEALLEEPLSADLAEVALTPFPKADPQSASDWLAVLKKESAPVGDRVARGVNLKARTKAVEPITFRSTVGKTGAESSYESDYWLKLIKLTKDDYLAKNNVDCPTQEKRRSTGKPTKADEALAEKYRKCVQNDLPDLAKEYLVRHYLALGLEVYTQAVPWENDFTFDWWGGKEYEHENIVVRIPGKSSLEAVVMADHFDTAYMADIYDSQHPKIAGHRQASEGADDNASGTAALMQAGEALAPLKGKLKRDVWLVHLTGEEFPADCLGARVLSQALVEKRPVLTGRYVLRSGRVVSEKLDKRDNPKIAGVYVLDMVAHDTGLDPASKARGFTASTFQISPGRGSRSAQLALLAHRVTHTWNSSTEKWNEDFSRSGKGARSKTLARPAPAELPRLRGEIRLAWHPRSSLFNTDGQIFSDAGIPVVLFMENYDIDREGYHDTHDTLANIDLAYGSALTRIAIESVAQRAMQ